MTWQMRVFFVILLNMWAKRRRTTIVLILLGAFGLFFVLPYWLTHQEVPTCTDLKMNQDEKGVDCGGACTLVCPGGAMPLTLLWTKVFPVRAGVYDVVAYVENANFTIGAPRVPYIAKLYDKEGVVIAEERGETYAKPNERFFIFKGIVLTGDRVAASGSIEIVETFSWYTEARAEQQFSVENKVLTGFDRKPRLSATLKNSSPTLYRNVDVTAVVYDTKGEPIGVSSTIVEKIEKNGSENIFFTWTKPFNFVSESEGCELPVDALLLLDRSGSMASESKNPPQPFTRVRDATAAFVSFLSSKDQVGMVSYSTTASNPVDVPLMSDLTRATGRILATTMGAEGIQYTNTGDVLLRAQEEFETQRTREDAKKVVVLLTDGEALEPNRPLRDGEPEFAKTYAKEMARALKDSGIALYTIGLGVNANADFLKSISTTPEYYFPSPSVADLRDVYGKVASAMCKKGPSAIEIIPRIK